MVIDKGTREKYSIIQQTALLGSVHILKKDAEHLSLVTLDEWQLNYQQPMIMIKTHYYNNYYDNYYDNYYYNYYRTHVCTIPIFLAMNPVPGCRFQNSHGVICSKQKKISLKILWCGVLEADRINTDGIESKIINKKVNKNVKLKCRLKTCWIKIEVKDMLMVAHDQPLLRRSYRGKIMREWRSWDCGAYS